MRVVARGSRAARVRALVARRTKRKQEAEAEDGHAPPQGRLTLEVRAGSVVDDAPEERPLGRSLRASLGPAWAALPRSARGGHMTRPSSWPCKSQVFAANNKAAAFSLPYGFREYYPIIGCNTPSTGSGT
eukprot:scaffold34110_cov74-Phaeocystis_antarctica.AAC.11